jgi:sugar lactone lactonase YvrE
MCATTLASGQAGAVAIAVDASNVYWVTPSTVMKVPIEGGTPTTLANGQTAAQAIAVSANDVYWVTNYDGGAVMKVPIAGGTPITFAGGVYEDGAESYFPNDVVLDASNVYWTTGREVYQAPLAGGDPVALLGGVTRVDPGALAVDATDVYYAQRNMYSGGVRKVPIGGGTDVGIDSTGATYSVAVDGSNIYWVNYLAGWLMKTPIAPAPGPPLSTTLATGLAAPMFDMPDGVAVDATDVYVANRDGGTVLKVPLAGGSQTVVGKGTYPRAVAVDATNVYWLNDSDGTVMKAAKDPL